MFIFRVYILTQTVLLLLTNKREVLIHSIVSGAGKDMNFWVLSKEILEIYSEHRSVHIQIYSSVLWKYYKIPYNIS